MPTPTPVNTQDAPIRIRILRKALARKVGDKVDFFLDNVEMEGTISQIDPATTSLEDAELHPDDRSWEYPKCTITTKWGDFRCSLGQVYDPGTAENIPQA